MESSELPQKGSDPLPPGAVLPAATCSAQWFYDGWHRKTIKTEQGAATLMEIMSLRPDEIAVWKRARARRTDAALRVWPNDKLTDAGTKRHELA
ncbi:MAG: hypothetical protein IPO08_21085 [Xanthomonadales bacterium]|nr:hypothetical protein [Xanthomonadales bacterium]